jgi:hypothetical protein
MTNVTAIKVVIGLRSNGHADHPDWDLLPLVTGGVRPEDHQIVKWKYDKTSGHDTESADSPLGTQLGMMLVTETFATDAVATFPTLVTRMTEAQALTFWEDKAHAHMADDRRDQGELSSLHAEFILIRDLAAEFPGNAKLQNRLTALKVLLQKALDPNDPAPGVRKNIERRWADVKADKGLVYVEPV